jgi:hypothetical protein
MTKTIIRDIEIEDDKLELIKGEFLNQKGFKEIFRDDVDCFDNKGKLIFIFRKNTIPQELSKVAYKNLISFSKKPHDNRGLVAGKIHKDKIASDKVLWDKSQNPFRLKGYNSKYTNNYINLSYGNISRSNIIGYFERKLIDKRVKKTQEELGLLSGFNRNFPDKWKNVLPYIQQVANIYKKNAPIEYNIQNSECNKTKYRIEETPFTTITLNYNFRTALHKDSGDFKEGLSCLTVLEQGEYEGYYLGLPNIRVAIDVREGDVLLFNPHYYHCNTELLTNQEYNRVSLVFYARTKVLNYKE